MRRRVMLAEALWIFKFLIGSIVAVIIVLFAVLWWIQDWLLYFPDNWIDNLFSLSCKRSALHYNRLGLQAPSEHGMDFEDVVFRTKDGEEIHGWLILQPEHEHAYTLLYFHGNAGNIGFRMGNLCELYTHCKVNILIIDYRGYGNSTGTPSEHGLLVDAHGALDYLLERDDIANDRIALFGRSLGGAVAIKLASQVGNRVMGVIVENTFTSIDAMVESIATKMRIIPVGAFLHIFLYLFVTSHWNSYLHIKNIRVPLLLFSGLADDLVPPSQMQTLYERSNDSQLYIVEEGTHNDTHEIGGQKYYSALSKFLSSARVSPSPRNSPFSSSM